MSDKKTREVAKQQDTNQQETEQVFEIRKIFIKDVSFESPNAPAIFTESEWTPEMNIQINGKNSSLGKDLYEVTLTVTATAKQDDKTAFLIEIQQAGVFGIKGYPDDALRGILGTYCLETLFPYAREAVDSLVIKGGFPPLLLNSINFNAIYQQQLESAQTPQEEKH